MFKNPITAERGDSPQGVTLQHFAPSTNFFDAKIPENAFSASKKRAFSGHFDNDGSRKTDTSRRGAARKNPFF